MHWVYFGLLPALKARLIDNWDPSTVSVILVSLNTFNSSMVVGKAVVSTILFILLVGDGVS